jgi:LSD1 subclass zinc finger protein
MGVYSIECNSCGIPFNWFSGNRDQRCAVCVEKEKKDSFPMDRFTDKDFDEFMEKNKSLMEALAKSKEVDNLRNRLEDLKSAHNLLGQLIKELEDEIQKS